MSWGSHGLGVPIRRDRCAGADAAVMPLAAVKELLYFLTTAGCWLLSHVHVKNVSARHEMQMLLGVNLSLLWGGHRKRADNVHALIGTTTVPEDGLRG